ncbi:MAG: 50S ribosomal protein L9 [Candidatus Sungbacteria bacterium RIFCSPLOWO2_01_FULL_59_16]|uniref:Large ribosomal subunit protein bL9 n=1 Tax=Candidatus Sungbacteria bacterium RIFCSPLOWO2_01_FULL_59_16 TaxID=1802280 RepID=A0A1G2LCC7_9BACT|nr:MAG: 50S ribosomal protein L9 [Candidatus Sungbacteria bacterium RIFCSPLOWO2_01_FULL_59_16]
MKVILLKEVPGLGRVGDVKTVRDGYGQNFLVARGLAKTATAAVLQRAESEKVQRTAHATKEQERFRRMADALQKTPLAFTMKVNEQGHAFGSVTSSDIQTALAKNGIALDRHWIALTEPIKTTGEHRVKIGFPHQVEGEIKVIVEAEDSEEAQSMKSEIRNNSK